jgi:hypothetical protein
MVPPNVKSFRQSDPRWMSLLEVRKAGHCQKLQHLCRSNVSGSRRSDVESHSEEQVKRHVRGARVTASNWNPRPRKRDLPLGGRKESPRDREALTGADERACAAEVIATAEEPSAAVHVAASNRAFRVRDHRPRSDAPVEDAPAARALDRNQVPAMRNLELIDVRRQVRQVDLVVEKLKLPSLAPAPE